MKEVDPRNASSAIRKRLFSLLFQSFFAVIVIMLIIVISTVFVIYYRVINYYPPFRPILSSTLEAYYQGHGSWEGVENLVPRGSFDPMRIEQNEWRDSILLDNQFHIILDHGNAFSPLIGQKYRMRSDDSPVPLWVNGREVGILVVTHLPVGKDVMDSLVLPFIVIVFFLGVLTLVFGFLLSTRLIKPLAEVISASHEMSSGNLGTRVTVQGPDDLRMLSDSFNQMAESLEMNDRNQRSMIADIAHELRTPLAVVQGKLEGIIDGIYPTDTEHVQPVLEQVIRLKNLISDLDTLAQAESNQLKFNIIPVNLDHLVAQSVRLFEIDALKRHITLQYVSENDLPLISGDPQRIGQVINNLVGNAIRYIPENGHVEVKIVKRKEGCELTVRDDGPGIPENDLPHVFERFWRVDKSRSRDSGGAGLGLAIARQFIEIQGGHIFATNSDRGGLEIGFIMPFATEE